MENLSNIENLLLETGVIIVLGTIFCAFTLSMLHEFKALKHNDVDEMFKSEEIGFITLILNIIMSILILSSKHIFGVNLILLSHITASRANTIIYGIFFVVELLRSIERTVEFIDRLRSIKISKKAEHKDRLA